MQVRGRPLHFGVQLQAQGCSWAEYARAVQGVEELGYSSVWTFDHMLPFSGPDDRPCFETLTTLSAMAVLTESVRIGVLVNGALYRDPATLAKASAQVDQMSGGRLDFSLGAGWAEREFRAYGLAFPSLAERYGRLDETLEIVRLLWSQERTTFHGRFYQINDAPCEPKPVQRPHPPVMVGGAGLGSLRIAARHADRLNLIGSPEKCAERIAVLKRLCAAAGRDFDEIELSVHPALVEIAPELSDPEVYAQRTATAVEPQDRQSLVGGPAEALRRLRRYTDVGVNHFVFALGYPFDLAPLRLLQEEVLPALA